MIKVLAFHDMTPAECIVAKDLTNLLGLGLKFCPSPIGITQQNLRTSLGLISQSLRLKLHFAGSDPVKMQSTRGLRRSTWQLVGSHRRRTQGRRIRS